MSQTVVEEQGLGFAGMKADSGFDDVVSKKCEVEIPFGKMAVQGTDEDQAALPTAAGDIVARNLIGMSVHNHGKEQVQGATQGSYQANDVGGFMRKGRMVVEVEEAVAAGDEVFIRYAAGGKGLGSFGGTAGTSERAALPGAKYVQGAAADGLAIVQFDGGL